MFPAMVREKTKDDRAKINISPISKFGLLELSRQRLRPSIESMSYQTCACCEGRGIVPSVETAALSFLRRIRMGVSRKGIVHVQGELALDVAMYLQNRKRKDLAQLETRYGVDIALRGDTAIPPGAGKLEFLKESRTPELTEH